MDSYNLVFIDCEGRSPAPTLNDDTKFEFWAVDYESRQSFHGQGGTKETFESFYKWLKNLTVDLFLLVIIQLMIGNLLIITSINF